MRFLPVVQRELRTAARRPLTHWVRFLCGLASSLFLAWFWFMDRPTVSSTAGGRELFSAITGLAFTYCLGIGLVITSDCLSEEKREGTLGLLFLTDLKGYDVILGKLAATSMHALYGLIAVFPLMAIPLLLGGLTAGEFERALLVLTNVLFLSLAAGLAASAMSRAAWKARMGTLALLILATLGGPLLGWLFASVTRLPYNDAFSTPSAVYAFFELPDKSFRAARSEFWNSTFFTSAFTLGCLLVASVAAPRSWQDKPAGARLSQFLARWKSWSLGDSIERVAFRRRLLDQNAFYWLAARERLKPAIILAVLGFSGVWWCWLAIRYPETMFEGATYIATGLVLHTFIKLRLASEATRLFCEDRGSGALELVLSTSLTTGEILHGQLLALRRQFGLASGVIVFADFCMLHAGWFHQYAGVDSNWALSALAGIAMFVLDLFALSWVGMWLGLKSKRPGRAAIGTIARILGLPWGIFSVFLTFATLFDIQSRLTDGSMLALWFLIGAMVDIVFLFWARNNLYQYFRIVATERFERTRWSWRSLSPFFRGPAARPASLAQVAIPER